MRISDSTVIYENKSGKYLINFPAGNIDRVGSGLGGEIRIIKEKATFENPTVSFSTKTLNYLKERKYITSLSPWEEKRENERKIEKRKAKAKIQHKRRSIVLDPEIGSAWCNFGENNDQQLKHIGDQGSGANPIPILEKILDKLEKDDSNKIDIWLNLEKREDDWEEIYSFLQENGLVVGRVWSVVNPDRKSYFVEWARDYLFSEEIGMSLKTLNLVGGQYYEVTPAEEFEESNLWTERLTSLFKRDVAYFTCPFLYNSVFVSKGSISHCVEKVQRKEDDSQEDVVLEDKSFEDRFSLDSWDKSKDYTLASISDFTCPQLTEKFKSDEVYYKAFFQGVLDETINELSVPKVEEGSG